MKVEGRFVGASFRNIGGDAKTSAAARPRDEVRGLMPGLRGGRADAWMTAEIR
ncbi:MAG: hypothetical protein WCL50_15505 [Spirochaetota bacterium]